MVSTDAFTALALSFPDTEEQPHFEKRSFRVKKKIFATLSEAKHQAVLKLSPEDQSVFCKYDEKIFYPATGAWGKQGWTIVELKKVRKDMFKDALTEAYRTVAKKERG